MRGLKFPWANLKAETLRTICRDLSDTHLTGRREDMIAFLQSVEKSGLDTALEQVAPTPSPRKPTAPSTPQSRSKAAAGLSLSAPPKVVYKRDQEPVVSDYNMRHREKRIRFSDAENAAGARTPARKRQRLGSGAAAEEGAIVASLAGAGAGADATTRTPTRTRRRTAAASTTTPAQPSTKRPRGRQRKKPSSAPLPTRRRVVFDGVVLTKKPVSAVGKSKSMEGAMAGGPAASTSTVALLSPRESNKENEVTGEQRAPPDTAHTNGIHLGSHVVGDVAEEPFDDAQDADGEYVTENDEIIQTVPSTAELPIPPVPIPLTAEDLNHLNQLVNSAIENGHL